MAKKPIYLKNRSETVPAFQKKGDFDEYLKEILHDYKNKHKSENGVKYIIFPQYISDLIDYLEDYYSVCHKGKYQYLIQKYNFYECDFIIDTAPDAEAFHATKYPYCFFIQSKHDPSKRDDFTKNFTLEEKISTEKQLIKARLATLIHDIKAEIKRKKLRELDVSDDIYYQICHKCPTWKEITDDFINRFLNEVDLRQVISCSTQDEPNLPTFKAPYQYLDEKFIEYYKNLNIQYSLKETKR